METKEKNQELKFIINRYDQYYTGLNKKGSFYMTINTFALAGIITGFHALNNQLHFGIGMIIIFAITVLLDVAAITLTLLAIMPYINKKKDNKNGSVVYFGDVADYHENQYEKLWSEINEDKWNKDLIKQTQLLAIGLKKKFNYLYYATWLIAGLIFLIIVFGMLILNK